MVHVMMNMLMILIGTTAAQNGKEKNSDECVIDEIKMHDNLPANDDVSKWWRIRAHICPNASMMAWLMRHTGRMLMITNQTVHGIRCWCGRSTIRSNAIAAGHTTKTIGDIRFVAGGHEVTSMHLLVVLLSIPEVLVRRIRWPHRMIVIVLQCIRKLMMDNVVVMAGSVATIPILHHERATRRDLTA